MSSCVPESPYRDKWLCPRNDSQRNFSWITGTPDYIIDHVNGYKAIIEVKKHWHPSPSEAQPISDVSLLPLKHWLQVQTYLEINDLTVGYLWSWTILNSHTCLRIRRDRDFFQNVILPEVLKFRHGYLLGVSCGGHYLKELIDQYAFQRCERRDLVQSVRDTMLRHSSDH